jgi:hypothetical protein
VVAAGRRCGERPRGASSALLTRRCAAIWCPAATAANSYRRCRPHRSSWTKRLITAKDHAAVQINIGNVDAATGRYTGEFKTFALCGYIRDKVKRGGEHRERLR